MEKAFFKYKKIFCAFSVFLAVGSIASLLSLQINWGMEFIGGTISGWKFTEPVQEGEILNLYLENNVGVENIVETEGNSYLVYSEKLENDAVQEIFEFAQQKYPSVEQSGVETAGRMVERDSPARIIISISLIAFLSMIFFFYSFGNLRKKYSPWIFTFCGCAAVVFDIVAAGGILSLLGKCPEFVFTKSLLVSFFALIIFSIFSKSFIFNEIRDNLLEYKKEDISTVLNRVMSANLPTIVTVLLIVIISLLPIISFGSRNFQNPSVFLLTVILISTYSGLFVTHQLILLFSKKAVPVSTKSASKHRKKMGRKKK